MRILIVGFLILLSGSQLYGQDASPYVPDYGAIHDLENVIKPDPAKDYKIVIDLKTDQSNPKQINYGLNNVARMLNLHGVGGVPLQNLYVSVAIHGGATNVVLSDAAYKGRYGVINPNRELIKQLKEAGVNLYVCGQSLKARGYDFGETDTNIEIGLSMLTIVTERLMDGYGLLVFD